MGRTRALPKTWVVSPAMRSSSRPLLTLRTRSTTAISNGSVVPLTLPSSTWPPPTPLSSGSADLRLLSTSLGPGAGQAIALGAGLDDVAVEGHPVDHGRHQSRVANRLCPFGERQIGHD